MPSIQVLAKPHPGQIAVHASSARFKVLSAGRRWGKTRLGTLECLDVAARSGRAWWVAPTYKTSEVGWRPLSRLARRIPGADVRVADRQILLPSGGEISVRSADTEGGLRGEGLDFVVFDEAAFTRETAWTEEIRPALSDRLGRALFISTPRGRNWFWALFQRGQTGEPNWFSWQFPTATNPFIALSEIDDAQRDLPELVFRQEYLAEFVDMEGTVFRRIQDAATAEPLDRYSPLPGHVYIGGADIAASVDYTVVSVLDLTTRSQVYQDRFNRVDFPTLEDRLWDTYVAFGLESMTIEANSIGQSVIDHLSARGMNVVPFITTQSTKQVIITDLQSAFEHGEITILNDPILISELLSFEAHRSPSGAFSYSAPPGLHDDCVMALAIVYNAAANPQGSLLFAL